MMKILKSIWTLTCAMGLLTYICGAQEIKITSIGFDENGRVLLTVEGPAGEYQVQSSEDLSSEGNWGSLCRLGNDGSTLEVSEPVDENKPVMFYRVRVFPTADGFHVTGEFAQALDSTVSYSDLQSAFGLTFTEVDAVIPAVDDLSWATRNARVYAATIAALSKIAQDIRDSFAPGSQPSTGEIIAALSSDLSDGKLDGLASGTPIAIGTTGSNLPAYDPSIFNASVAEIQTDMPGLDNIAFTDNLDGTLGAAAPAVWGNFYWDSSDWQ